MIGWMDIYLGTVAGKANPSTVDTVTEDGSYGAPWSLAKFWQNVGGTEDDPSGIDFSVYTEIRIKGVDDADALLPCSDVITWPGGTATYLESITRNSAWSSDYVVSSSGLTRNKPAMLWVDGVPGSGGGNGCLISLADLYENGDGYRLNAGSSWRTGELLGVFGKDVPLPGVKLFNADYMYELGSGNTAWQYFFNNIYENVKISCGWDTETTQNFKTYFCQKGTTNHRQYWFYTSSQPSANDGPRIDVQLQNAHFCSANVQTGNVNSDYRFYLNHPDNYIGSVSDLYSNGGDYVFAGYDTKLTVDTWFCCTYVPKFQRWYDPLGEKRELYIKHLVTGRSALLNSSYCANYIDATYRLGNWFHGRNTVMYAGVNAFNTIFETGGIFVSYEAVSFSNGVMSRDSLSIGENLLYTFPGYDPKVSGQQYPDHLYGLVPNTEAGQSVFDGGVHFSGSKWDRIRVSLYAAQTMVFHFPLAVCLTDYRTATELPLSSTTFPVVGDVERKVIARSNTYDQVALEFLFSNTGHSVLVYTEKLKNAMAIQGNNDAQGNVFLKRLPVPLVDLSSGVSTLSIGYSTSADFDGVMRFTPFGVDDVEGADVNFPPEFNAGVSYLEVDAADEVEVTHSYQIDAAWIALNNIRDVYILVTYTAAGGTAKFFIHDVSLIKS